MESRDRFEAVLHQYKSEASHPRDYEVWAAQAPFSRHIEGKTLSYVVQNRLSPLTSVTLQGKIILGKNEHQYR